MVIVSCFRLCNIADTMEIIKTPIHITKLVLRMFCTVSYEKSPFKIKHVVFHTPYPIKAINCVKQQKKLTAYLLSVRIVKKCTVQKKKGKKNSRNRIPLSDIKGDTKKTINIHAYLPAFHSVAMLPPGSFFRREELSLRH